MTIAMPNAKPSVVIVFICRSPSTEAVFCPRQYYVRAIFAAPAHRAVRFIEPAILSDHL